MTTETRLRGKDLKGAEQPDAADHEEYLKKRNPDAELRLDGESDALYDDGIEVEDDSETLADTHGQRHTGG